MKNLIIFKDRCNILAPTISTVYVDCNNIDEFRHIITFVSCMENNGWGSFKYCGPKKKVFVHGFRESLFSSVKNGCPPVYELELENAVLIWNFSEIIITWHYCCYNFFIVIVKQEVNKFIFNSLYCKMYIFVVCFKKVHLYKF